MNQQMTRISAVEYDMTVGGTLTVRKAEGPGWDVTFSVCGDTWTENVPSVPDWIQLVTDYCGGWPAAGRSID